MLLFSYWCHAGYVVIAISEVITTVLDSQPDNDGNPQSEQQSGESKIDELKESFVTDDR